MKSSYGVYGEGEVVVNFGSGYSVKLQSIRRDSEDYVYVMKIQYKLQWKYSSEVCDGNEDQADHFFPSLSRMDQEV